MKRAVVFVSVVVLAVFAVVLPSRRTVGKGVRLVVCTPATDVDIDAVRTGFAKEHPEIELEFVQCSAGECFARIAAEASNPVIDVMYSGLNSSDGRKYESLFEAYVSAQPISGEYRSNGFYNFDRISTVCFCVNVAAERELGLRIAGYGDLLDPRLRGKVIISDPNSSSAAWNNLSNIFAVFGYDSPESWDYVSALFGNGLVVCQSSSLCFSAVERGEYAVGLTFEDGASVLLKGGSDKVRVVYPEEGVSGFAFGSAVVKGAPHRKEAEAFVDWLQSPEGQKYRSDVSGTSRFIMVDELPEERWIPDGGELKWIGRDVAWLAENRDAMIGKWNRLYGGRVIGTDM